MGFLQILSLAFVQGITEFLPISSSAHLILLPGLVPSWSDQGLAFDVALHVGSLAAVLWYFRKDLKPLSTAWFKSLREREQTAHSRLVWAVLFGTVPVGLAGLFLSSYVDVYLRSVTVIAGATIGFGLLLWFSDVQGSRRRNEYSITFRDVMIIGLAQALALIPGTSRSGITITAALLCGLERRAAARFSFLLSIPVIVLAGSLETVKLIRQQVPVEWSALFLGAVFSALSAYFCIHLFIRFLERTGMFPFVIYRLLLGAGLLLWVA